MAFPKGGHHTEAAKKKMAESSKGIRPWNKGKHSPKKKKRAKHLSLTHKQAIAKARTHPRREPGVLTDIERSVLLLRIQGYHHRAIANRLYLEYQSVKNITSRSYKILGVHSLSELRLISF